MILKYVLSKGRGLCSTLNSLLGMAHLCTKKNKIKINIDSSRSLIFKELSFFDTFKPKVISQKELFENYLNQNTHSENKDMVDKTIDMLGGSNFENMGDQFLNISFYSI